MSRKKKRIGRRVLKDLRDHRNGKNLLEERRIKLRKGQHRKFYNKIDSGRH